MYKIYKRDEFINEVYNPMIEQKEYQELEAINEGLLKTLFGAAKNLFKKDWSTIKGDPGIIKVYKEMDDALTGFSLMKLSKKDICNQVRQALVDFACDWYDKKMNDAKKDDTDPTPAKGMKFKDDTLAENLENTKKKIRTIIDGDEQMTKWANLLMDDMTNVINRTILDDIEDSKTKKEVEDMVNQKMEEKEKANKEMSKWQSSQLKEIKQEREGLITDLGATLISTDVGDKALVELNGVFKKTMKDNEINQKAITGDKFLGLKELYKNIDLSKPEFKTAYALMESVYRNLADNTVAEKFKETPGKSVQAMCISINAFIKHCIYGDTDYSKTLPLMAKCAVISNGVVSYNLPLNDAAVEDINSDDAGNKFTDLIDIITSGKMTDKENKKIELSNDFKSNSKKLFDKIKKEAAKLKEEADKNYSKQLEKLDLKQKNEEEI